VLDRVGAPDITDDEIATIQQTIIDTGALDELEAHITKLTDEAVGAIAAMPISDDARSELTQLAGYVSWRDV
jgi:geranylgeranyl diphosphate synthase type I